MSGGRREATDGPPVGKEGALESPGFGNLAFFLDTKSSILPEKIFPRGVEDGLANGGDDGLDVPAQGGGGA